MLALEINVNGKRVCLAGTGTSDVLSAGISWVRRAADDSPDKLRFNVGGIVAGENHKHFGWHVPKLGVGDEITIRLVDVESCDEPDHIYEPAKNPNAPTSPTQPPL